MTGLAHAADDHAPMAIENQQQRLHEVAIDAVGQRQYGVGFDAQNLAGKVERFRRGLYLAHEEAAVIMGEYSRSPWSTHPEPAVRCDRIRRATIPAQKAAQTVYGVPSWMAWRRPCTAMQCRERHHSLPPGPIRQRYCRRPWWYRSV
jgi:hypothetical protein